MKQLLNKVLFHHVIRDHVLLGSIASLGMFPFFGWTGCALFAAATVLIDLDHYAKFLWLTRFRYWGPSRSSCFFHKGRPGRPQSQLRFDWRVLGPSAMFLFFEEIHNRRHRPEFLIVEYAHTVEVLGLLACATFFWGGVLVPVFAGMLFHEFVDMIHLIHLKVLTKRCHSLIEYAWRVRKLRKRGLDPEALYREVREATGLL